MQNANKKCIANLANNTDWISVTGNIKDSAWHLTLSLGQMHACTQTFTILLALKKTAARTHLTCERYSAATCSLSADTDICTAASWKIVATL